MEHTPDGAPPLVAAPRHLRRRRLHMEIPDVLLVPGAEPVPFEPLGPTDPPAASAQDTDAQRQTREMLHRRKRLVAFVAILIVAVSLAALVLVLLLG